MRPLHEYIEHDLQHVPDDTISAAMVIHNGEAAHLMFRDQSDPLAKLAELVAEGGVPCGMLYAFPDGGGTQIAARVFEEHRQDEDVDLLMEQMMSPFCEIVTGKPLAPLAPPSPAMPAAVRASPGKGFFTQGVALLLSELTSIDDLLPILAEFEPSYCDSEWKQILGGDALQITFRRRDNGYVVIEVQEGSWPDEMGDPQNSPELYAAWANGEYGPFTVPGALARAADNASMNFSKSHIVPAHAGFIRIRLTYQLGREGGVYVLPRDYNPFAEAEFVNNVVAALFKHPAAIAFFNPNGEVLCNAAEFEKFHTFTRSQSLPPLDTFAAIRMHILRADWRLIDCVGQAQLDLPDVEVCYLSNRYHALDIGDFVRAVTLRVIQNGLPPDGTEIGGMDGTNNWLIRVCEQSYAQPIRRVLRLFPQDGSKLPKSLLPD